MKDLFCNKLQIPCASQSAEAHKNFFALRLTFPLLEALYSKQNMFQYHSGDAHMLTIGEFSKICMVSAKTLRYYDQIGLLKPGYVSRESGYRYYEAAQLKDMLLITRLKRYGFSLPEIAAAMAARDSDALAARMRAKREIFLGEIRSQQRILFQMEQDIQKIERHEDIMQTNYAVHIVQMQPKTIFSVRRIMGLRDFGDAFGALAASLEKSGLRPVGPFLSIYHDEEFNPERSDIEVAAEVRAEAGGGVRVFDPGLCCFAEHTGPYDDFSPCYAALMEWIDHEGYTLSGPPFEVYVKGCESGLQPAEYVTEIYFPVTK